MDNKSSPGFLSLESEVLQKLVGGDHPVLLELKRQLLSVIKIERTLTGVGFFLSFTLPSEQPKVFEKCDVKPDFWFGDVEAAIDGLNHGAGFVLWVRDGIISDLEGYTYGEVWPDTINKFTVTYIGGNRNMKKLEERWTR